MLVSVLLFAAIAHAQSVSPNLVFSLTSDDFFDRGIIPPKHSFAGGNVIPQLSFHNVPQEAVTLALILSDPDAEPVVGETVFHWLAYNIPVDHTLDVIVNEQGSPPIGSFQGVNIFGEIGYGGPGPPNGYAHGYTFTLYAVDSLLPLDEGTDPDTLLAELDLHAVQQTQIVGFFANNYDEDPTSSELTLTSPAFTDGGVIPERFTNAGEGDSLPFEFGGVPDGTDTLLLIMDDPNAAAKTVVHSIWYNIPADAAGIPENGVPDGTLFGINQGGEMNYRPPAPLVGDPAHSYRFTLSAVASPIIIDQENATKPEILNAAFTAGILEQVRIHGFWGIPPESEDVIAPISGSGMTISTSVFSNFGPIPLQFTAVDGEDNVNPPLHIVGIPGGAASIAIVVSDPTAPGKTFFHWAIFNIPTNGQTEMDIASGEVPTGASQGKNDFGDNAYDGPLPPKGPAHEYHFTVFALGVATLPGLSDGADPLDILDAIAEHNIIDPVFTSEIVGLFVGEPLSALTVTSPDFPPFGIIPDKYTQFGDGTNPAFTFGEVPDGTKSLIFIIDDPDAPVPGTHVFDHWVVYNIPPDAGGIEANSVPDGAEQGLNGAGQAMYTGPAPPDGLAHHYRFSLYAVSDTVSFDSTPTKNELLVEALLAITQVTEMIAYFGVVPGQNDPPLFPSGEDGESSPPELDFAITSDDFFDRGTIPLLNTFAGGNVIPQLSFHNVPREAKTLALILSDPDAEPVVGETVFHWIVWNIPVDFTLDVQVNKRGQAPPGAFQGTNIFGEIGYGGPGPPDGYVHDYTFTLYAVDSLLAEQEGADPETILAELDFHAIQRTQIVGLFSPDFDLVPGGGEMTLTSSAFTDGGVLPIDFTSAGAGDSLPFQLGGVPDGTDNLLLIMDDPNAPGRTIVHTIWYNIPADTTEIPINDIPVGALFGVNTQGLMEYDAPTPRPGNPAHGYRFTLSAVASPIDIDQADATKENILMAAFNSGIIQQVRIRGFWGVLPDSDEVIAPASGSGLTISSSQFANFGPIPPEFTALDGEDNVNPPLHIAGIPSKAPSIAIILSDPTAPGGTVFHWVIFNIATDDQDTIDIDSGVVPDGASQGVNVFGDNAYGGPLPPAGPAHEYHFEVFALDVATLPDISDGADPQDVLDAIDQHNVIDPKFSSEIVGLFVGEPVSALTITSPDFPPFGLIPRQFSQFGSSTNPTFTFGEIPDGTETLVFIMDDPDAPVPGTHVFDHWVVYNIPVDAGGIAANSVPTGAAQGLNGAGVASYVGPAPPDGLAHHYRFTLYAVGGALTFDHTPVKNEVLQAALGQGVSQVATMIGFFGVFPGDNAVVDDGGDGNHGNQPNTGTTMAASTTNKALLATTIIFAVLFALLAICLIMLCVRQRKRVPQGDGDGSMPRRESEMAKADYQKLEQP